MHTYYNFLRGENGEGGLMPGILLSKYTKA